MICGMQSLFVQHKDAILILCINFLGVIQGLQRMVFNLQNYHQLTQIKICQTSNLKDTYLENRFFLFFLLEKDNTMLQLLPSTSKRCIGRYTPPILQKELVVSSGRRADSTSMFAASKDIPRNILSWYTTAFFHLERDSYVGRCVNVPQQAHQERKIIITSPFFLY